MTLQEWLKSAGPDTLIYLGAIDSSGFMAIDTPGAILNRLGSIDSANRNALIQSIASSARIVSRTQIPAVISERNKRTGKKKSAAEMKREAAEKKKIAEKKIETSRSYLKRCSQILIDWVPMEMREIADVYEHTVDKPGITIIVEGYARTGYWFKHEYDEANTKGKKKNEAVSTSDASVESDGII